MASRRFDPLKVLGFGRVAVRGRFFTNGSSPVDQTKNKGKGWTVTRTGVGIFDIIFTDRFLDLEDVHLTAHFDAVTFGWAGVTVRNWVPSTKTMTIVISREFSGTIGNNDMPASADNSVSFMAVLKNSSI